MNTLKLAALLILLGISSICFGQRKSFTTIKEALDYHTQELKSNIGNYDHIFIVTSLEESIVLPPNIYQIENSLNARFLKKKDKNYLVKLVFHPTAAGIQFDAVNYSVTKISNKKITISNLLNGSTYIISP